MNGFFNIDGPFYRFGNTVADVCICGFLWLIFSIPLITIGASTTALYYVMLRRASDKEGYLFADFWKSFKCNFKISTAVWLIVVVLSTILYINIKNIDQLGSMKTIIFPMQLCFAMELIMICMYVFPIISRFDLKLLELFKSAFLMANRHILNTILCLLIFVAIYEVSVRFIPLSLFAVSLYAFITSFLFMRIFKKYRPEIDAEL